MRNRRAARADTGGWGSGTWGRAETRGLQGSGAETATGCLEWRRGMRTRRGLGWRARVWATDGRKTGPGVSAGGCQGGRTRLSRRDRRPWTREQRSGVRPLPRKDPSHADRCSSPVSRPQGWRRSSRPHLPGPSDPGPRPTTPGPTRVRPTSASSASASASASASSGSPPCPRSRHSPAHHSLATASRDW